MRPRRRSIMPGSTARVQRNVPFRLTPRTLSKSASDVEVSGGPVDGAGGVDQQLDGTQPALRLLHEFGDLTRLGDIGRRHERVAARLLDPVLHGNQPHRTPRRDADRETAFGQPQRGGRSDPLTRAGDDGHRRRIRVVCFAARRAAVPV